MQKLLKILKEVRDDVDFENEQHLIDDEILDSFDIVDIVSEISSEFDVNITVNELLPENFNSADAMWNLIETLKNNI